MSAQRRVRFAAFGGPEVLEVVDDALPHPGPGEVRVRVEASSVQFTDTLIRRGIYPGLSEKPPLTPGYDLVGRVDEVGEGVDAWAVGDRVADLCQWGGNARFVVRPAAGLVAVPEAVDATAAVSLVLSWLTAYQAAFTVGRLQPGERLLVIGGNGAVGQALEAYRRPLPNVAFGRRRLQAHRRPLPNVAFGRRRLQVHGRQLPNVAFGRRRLQAHRPRNPNVAFGLGRVPFIGINQVA